MALFTGSYTDPLSTTPEPVMQGALNLARQGLSAAGTSGVNKLALIVVALTGFAGSTSHPWAALRDNEEHYSASLLKIAAMYAAFDLRASADQLAATGGHSTWASLEAAMRAQFNPEIDAHTPALISGSAALRTEDKRRKPSYSAMLRMGSGADWSVDFTAAQLNAFEDMIVEQNNPGATFTIHGLGYPFLNGKLADDGFFSAGSGIWLAGDYAQQWPAARIASINDGAVAQATTARALARFLTLLYDRQLVGPLSSAGMLDLLGRAGAWFHFPELLPAGAMIWPAGGRFRVTHSKVGNGPLKNGLSAFSEALIVRDDLKHRDFAVVWQNVQDTIGPDETPFRRSFEPVARLIEATISAFQPF